MKTSPLLLLAFVCGISLAVRLSAFADAPATPTNFRGLTLPQWIERLAKGRFGDTPAAWDDPPTETLDALPSFGFAAVPPLTEALRHESPIVRYNAATALSRINADRKVAVPALITLLKDDNVPVRATAADALRSIDSDAAAAIPALEKLLDDPNDQGAGEPIPLVHGRPFYWSPSRSAWWALAAIGPKSVPVILARLKSEDADIRQEAAVALSSFSSEAATIVPALTLTLDDAVPIVRGTAADSLREFGQAAKSATAALTRHALDSGEYAVPLSLTTSGFATVGERSIVALRAIGPTSEDVTILVKALVAETDQRRDDLAASERRPDPRPALIELLGDLKSETKRTLPALSDALDIEELRFDAALSLLRLKTQHPRVRETLLESLSADTSENVFWHGRLQAIRLIQEQTWSDAATVLALEAALNDDDGEVQLAASGGLLCLVPDHSKAQQVFLEHVQEFLDAIFRPFYDSEETRIMLLTTLEQSSRAAELAMPATLKQATSRISGDDETRSEIIEFLAAIGPKGNSAVPDRADDLESAIRPEGRRVAAFVLGFAGKMNRRAASALLIALKDEDDSVRAIAAESLGRIGIPEAIVLSELEAALDDESLAVREKAAESLKLLKPAPAPR